MDTHTLNYYSSTHLLVLGGRAITSRSLLPHSSQDLDCPRAGATSWSNGESRVVLPGGFLLSDRQGWSGAPGRALVK